MAVRLKSSRLYAVQRRDVDGKLLHGLGYAVPNVFSRKIAGVGAEKGFLICFIIVSTFLRCVSGTKLMSFMDAK